MKNATINSTGVKITCYQTWVASIEMA